MNDTMRKGPVKGKWPGVAAIDVNGERYCIDCAKAVLDNREVTYQCNDDSWETVDNANGDDIVSRLIDGDIYTLSMGGVVLSNQGDGDVWHCSRSKGCVNALYGDEHTYDHTETIGVKLDI